MVVAVTVVYSVGTVTRNPVWKDDISLWTDTVEKSPVDVYALNNLAVAYNKMGRVEEAKAELMEARRLDPAWPVSGEMAQFLGAPAGAGATR